MYQYKFEIQGECGVIYELRKLSVLKKWWYGKSHKWVKYFEFRDIKVVGEIYKNEFEHKQINGLGRQDIFQ